MNTEHCTAAMKTAAPDTEINMAKSKGRLWLHWSTNYFHSEVQYLSYLNTAVQMKTIIFLLSQYRKWQDGVNT